MLRNRTLPIVALLAGAMMFGACAEDVAGPSKGGITVVPAVPNPNGPIDYDADLPDDALVNSPDGDWTEPHRPSKRTAD
jgi:hypothetical protein